MIVGICRLKLFFGGCGSLKEKRQNLRRLVDRLRHRFNAAVAEVGDQDTWQRSTVAISVVGNEGGHVQSMLDKIFRAAETLCVAQILSREVELLHYNEEEGLGEDSPQEWGLG